MMEMDGRDSAKCRKSKLRDIRVILEILNLKKTKRGIVTSPTYEKEKAKREKGGIRYSSLDLLFLVREHPTSL